MKNSKKIAKLLYVTILTVASSVVMLTNASADTSNGLKMELQANKVITNNDGKISYVPINTADGSTIVQYKAIYTNTLTTPINDISVTLPIPIEMVFTGTVSPTDAQATVDGKNFAAMPLMRKVDGKLVKVPYSEYKALRWQIKYLPAGKSAAISANTRLNTAN